MFLVGLSYLFVQLLALFKQNPFKSTGMFDCVNIAGKVSVFRNVDAIVAELITIIAFGVTKFVVLSTFLMLIVFPNCIRLSIYDLRFSHHGTGIV